MSQTVNMDTITRAAELYRDADSFVACLRQIKAEFDDPHQVMVAQLMAIFLENREAFDKMAKRKPVNVVNVVNEGDLSGRMNRAMKFMARLRSMPYPQRRT